MITIKSTLEKIVSEVFVEADFTTAKNIAVDHLKTTNVKDKNKMIYEINNARNMQALHRYLCNALLKYEGLGINNKREDAPLPNEDQQ